MSAFNRFPLRLQHAIVSRLGWSSLRPVQEQASQAILDGKNAIILAPTAGGKTEASVFPLLSLLMQKEPEQVGLLYIAPLKALLNNQEERLQTYTEMVGLRAFKWHGDVSTAQKEKFKKEPTQVLMTTPESLEVMLLSPKVPHPKLFSDLRAIIVDEIHAMAGTDRGAHLMSVLERIQQVTKNDIQRVGLSATVGNPHELLTWLQGTSKREAIVINPPADPSPKDLKILFLDSIREISRNACKEALGRKSLFFCPSRSLSEAIAERMQNQGTDVFVHHSSVSKEERAIAEERFHEGTNACIVCTSTLELGIDIGDLDLVLQANAPTTVSSFLQRLGRTGRRPNKRANTTFYCEDPEVILQTIALIELAREKWVESVPWNNRCWPVLVHQLFALTLQFGAVSKEKCWETLCVVPDFSGIGKAEFDGLVSYLIQKDFLYLSGGLLSLGDKAEAIFGRKNFMELYAVFSTPELYKVKTEAGYVLGTLEQAFADKLVEEMSSFLLSGKAWIVQHISHHERTIKVVPAPRGKKPSWGGFAPQILGYEICQKIKSVLMSNTPYPYLSSAGQNTLNAMREDQSPILDRDEHCIQYDHERALWWTYAGGQINHTLKYGLELTGGWKAVPDNFKLKIQGPGLTRDRLEEVIRTISNPKFWNNPSTHEMILKSLPNYRLSKFQVALPPAYSAEMISKMLLDVQATIDFLNMYNK